MKRIILISILIALALTGCATTSNLTMIPNQKINRAIIFDGKENVELCVDYYYEYSEYSNTYEIVASDGRYYQVPKSRCMLIADEVQTHG